MNRALVTLFSLLRPLLEPRLLLAAVLLAGAAWVFIELADEVIEGEAIAFDEVLFSALHGGDDAVAAAGPDWLVGAFRDITALGSYALLILVTLATAGYLMLAGQHRLACLIVAAAVGAIVWITLLKLGFDRPRPDLVTHRTEVQTASFPSGHSAGAAAVYLSLGAILARFQSRARLRLFFFVTALIITFLVGLSRVYLGVHWPSDVVAGWTLGGGWALFCWLVASWLEQQRLLTRTPGQSGGEPGDASQGGASMSASSAEARGSERST